VAFNKEKVMDAARKYVDKGQIDKAVKEYLRIVREDPKDVRVWLKIGDLYAKKGSKQEATETYLKVARFYQEQGFYLKAVAVYKQILKLDPRLVEVNLKLAELYRQLGLMSDAMQHFESVAAHFHREGKTKEALATVRQLVDLDPENVATRIKLAELYSKEGLVEEAATEFGQACEQLRKQGRQDDFIKVAERLLWHKPERSELSRELASLYLRRNDPRRALQKLQACFKADPRDVETLGLLAQAFQALDQKSKTVSVLKELARVFDENKARDKAEEVHRKILQFVANDPDSVAYLGERAKRQAAQQPSPPPAAQPVRPSRIHFTSEVQVLAPDSRSTGAMPLLDDKGLAADFSLPEYIEEAAAGNALNPSYADDFAADLSLEDGGYARAGSAAGEKHADEIAKILTETDVYVKYGLHQKAVDHLRRVFALDPENVEARERLKDVYLAQGRESDALAELVKLADQVAGSDTDRAEAYLREALGIDGGHRPAHEVARRHRLDLSSIPDVEVIDGGEDIELDAEEIGSGAVAAIEDDIEFEDIDFGESKPNPALRADSFDGIDPSMFQAQRPPTETKRDVAEARPVRALGTELGGNVGGDRPVARTSLRPATDSGRSLDMEEAAEELEFEDGVVEVSSESAWPQGWTGVPQAAPSLDDALDAHLDDSLGDAIDEEIAAELSGSVGPDLGGATFEDALAHDDLPFDPEAARAFDAAVPRPRATSGFGSVPTFDPAAAAEFDSERPDFGETPAPRALGASAMGADQLGAYGYRDRNAPSPRRAPARDDYLDPGDPGAAAHIAETREFGLDSLDQALDAVGAPDAAFAYSGGGDEALAVGNTTEQTFDPGAAGLGDHTAEQDEYEPIGESAVVAANAVSAAAPASTLEDDLDEADFYVSQGMLREAADLLHQLIARHPGHPLVSAKLRDVDAASGRGPGLADFDPGDPGDQGALDELDEVASGAEPLELDDVEEIDADLLQEGTGDTGAMASPPKSSKRRPSVMLQKPVEDSDADTHYDLGLAYKEMGLYDEAIKAFEKVAQARGREVQCRLMMGLCHREQQNFSESVHQFKIGLHEPGINDREKQSLLYEIGVTYEAMGDPREALYYFEMVVKRDPNFLDARDRAAQLRASVAGGASNGRRPRPASDDPDGAIESLLADDP